MYICGIVAVQEIQGDGMPTQIFRRARVYGCACMHKMFKNFKPPIYFLKWSNLNEIHFTKAKFLPKCLRYIYTLIREIISVKMLLWILLH